MSDNRTSSYVASEVPIGLDKELERLRAQALITWDREARNLRWWGLKDDMSVLELGSGPGFVSEQLLQMVPKGNVVSVEIDPVLIEKSRNYLQTRSSGNWQLIEGNVMSTGLPDNSFDFVYGRYLFQHLPDPVGAAREALRVLKPGGKLVITDVDDSLNVFDPPPQGELKVISDRLEKAFQDQQALKGGNRMIGRQLPSILKAAGFEAVDLEALVIHSQLVDMSGMMPKPTIETMRHHIDRGEITVQEAEMMIQYEEEFQASDHIIMPFLLMGCGQKPNG